MHTPALGEGGFVPYAQAIRGHPWIVALVTLTAMVGAGVWLLVRTPTYTATSEILVSPLSFGDTTYVGLPGVIRESTGDPTRAVQTAAAMIGSASAAALAARRLGTDWNAGRVRASVTVTPLGGTNVLAVAATANEAGRAARVADTFTQAALEEHRQALAQQAPALIAGLESAPGPPSPRIGSLQAVSHGMDPTFSLLNAATRPSSPTGRPLWRILSTTLFAGLILGTGVALLSDRAMRRLRTRNELGEAPGGSSSAGGADPPEPAERADQAAAGVVRKLPRP